MSLIKKLWQKLFKKNAEKDVVIVDEVVDTKTANVISHGQLVVDQTTDMSKLEQSLIRRRTNLQKKASQSNETIGKLLLAQLQTDDPYFCDLYEREEQRESKKLEEVSAMLNVTDEEATSAIIDKATLAYLKDVKRAIKLAEQKIKSRSNPVAKKFVENIRIAVPKGEMLNNVTALLSNIDEDQNNLIDN